MSKQDPLLALGLNNEECQMYRALLEKGALSISELAEYTGLYRPLLYRHLPKLIEKSLINESKRGKRKVYSAEDPRNLKQLAHQIEYTLNAELPILQQVYAASLSRPVIRYYYGVHGIRNAYFDLLRTIKKGDTVYRYESPQNHKAYERYVPDEYRDRILQKTEVDWLIITNETTRNRKTKRLGRSLKATPSGYGSFVYDITQFIYHDKVSFIDFKNETASIIESPTFAEFQRKIFKMFWDRL